MVTEAALQLEKGRKICSSLHANLHFHILGGNAMGYAHLCGLTIPSQPFILGKNKEWLQYVFRIDFYQQFAFGLKK
jgi:hypothetical protein